MEFVNTPSSLWDGAFAGMARKRLRGDTLSCSKNLKQAILLEHLLL
jgi:hypothetical protein